MTRRQGIIGLVLFAAAAATFALLALQARPAGQNLAGIREPSDSDCARPIDSTMATACSLRADQPPAIQPPAIDAARDHQLAQYSTISEKLDRERIENAMRLQRGLSAAPPAPAAQ